MSKLLKVSYNDDDFGLQLGKSINRQDLYGRIEKKVTKDGVDLRKGVLTEDGRLFDSESISSITTDSNGSVTNTITKNDDGSIPEKQESSFKVVREFKERDFRLYDFITKSHYPILESDLPHGTYEGTFSYMGGFELNDAVAIINQDNGGGFLLVGEKREPQFIGRAVSIDIFDTDEEDDEEVTDFNMF